MLIASAIIMGRHRPRKAKDMKNCDIIDDLITIIEDYKERNNGCYPLCLESAIRALKWGISSRTIGLSFCDMDSFYDIPFEDIPVDAWEHLKTFDMDDSQDVKDFWSQLYNHYIDREIVTLLHDLSVNGYYYDYSNGFRYSADWI